MARNRTDNLTVEDFPALHIPDGPIAREWLAMMDRFLNWRRGETDKPKAPSGAGSRFNLHFFQWWFKTLRWRGKILDVGCGSGHKSGGLLTPALVTEYRGVDPLLVEETTSGKWQFHRGIGEVMPFVSDGWANVIVAFSVLQHCINPEQFMQECCRCMSRDPANRGEAKFYGTVCVRCTPEKSDLVSVDFRDGRHVAELLMGAGFRIERQQTFEQGLYCFEARLK